MKSKNTMDLVFLLSLFCVFVLCSFFVIFSQIQGYETMQNKSEDVLIKHTPSAYLMNKLKAHDQSAGMEIFDLEGTPCLALKEKDAVTYLFVDQGKLMEVYADRNYEIHKYDGSPLFDMDTIAFEKEGSRITITYQIQGVEETLHYTMKSKEE